MTIPEKLENFHSRGQIDVIEMWIKEEAIYKYLFIYEDCFSRFVVFKAMRTNSIQETARKLLDVITMIGAPQVLQSPKGREFTRHVVEELRTIWTCFSLLHGKMLKLEELNRDFRKSIDSWIAENPTKSWLEGIKIVQALENTSFKYLNEKVPFDLLFTCDIKDPFRCNKAKDFLAEEDWLSFKSNNIANNFNTQDYSKKDLNFTNSINIKNIKKNPVYSEMPIKSSLDNKKDEENKKPETDFYFIDVRSKSPIETLNTADSFSSDEEEVDNKEKQSIEPKDKLQCNICQKEYAKLGYLKNHLKCHTQTTYDCKLCSKSFRVQSLFNKHMKRFHTEPNPTNPDIPSKTNNLIAKDESRLNPKLEIEPESSKKKLKTPTLKIKKTPSASSSLECSYCKQKFDFPSVLKRHMRSHTNERPYSCQVCGKRFKQLGHLTQHTVTHTDYRSNRCARCSLKFDCLESLKLHALTHRGDEPRVHRLFECDACKKVFASKGVLERHVLTHTHERQFGCGECGKRFKQAGHVKSHMLVHTGEKRFACAVCEKRFSLANSLKKHMYVHNGEKPYQCDVCGARFLEKRNLNGHLMTHTNERPHSCKICGKRYTLADTLRRHISSAHGAGRTYQCEICAKMFKQLAHLSVHKKVHNDERPFQCHLCEKNFKHNNVLKSHLAIHANIRPFECDQCGATFVRKTNLQTHIASAHMNERPHVCRICGKRFKQVSHLNGHVVVHSNSMPYQCNFCDRRCNRLDNLKKHMRLHDRNKEQ